MTRNDEIIDKNLEEAYEIPESKYDGKYTKTSQFLLPAISLNIRNIHVSKFFVNAFLGDAEYKTTVQRPVFTLFSIKEYDAEWKAVYNGLKKKEEYVTDYDCGTKNGNNLLMVVFQVPNKYANEYFNFKLGRYSKFSDEYKALFPERIKDQHGNEKESITWGAMHLSERLRTEMNNKFKNNPFDKDLLKEGDEIWEMPRAFREYYRTKTKLKLPTF